jgi:CUB/sushi domain-containing protein
VCPRLSSPSSGLVNIVGNTATYTCSPPYKLVGNNRRICSNGIWSGRAPTCERSKPAYTLSYRMLHNAYVHICLLLVCASLGNPANGNVRVSGNSATYSCNLGYRLRGNTRRICSNGVWSGNAPSCDHSELTIHHFYGTRHSFCSAVVFISVSEP